LDVIGQQQQPDVEMILLLQQKQKQMEEKNRQQLLEVNRRLAVADVVHAMMIKSIGGVGINHAAAAGGRLYHDPLLVMAELLCVPCMDAGYGC
jgi:hypothetical protein